VASQKIRRELYESYGHFLAASREAARLAGRSIGWVRRRLCNLAARSDDNGNASACMTEHLN
jgi:hypothetical protein